MFQYARDVVSYLDLPRSLRVPIWREGRVVREIRDRRRMPPPDPVAHPLTIVVVPGFLDDGAGVEALSHRLEGAGHDVHRAELGRNIDCTEQMAQRLERRVADVASATGDRVVLLGHSRGGTLAKVVATRRPDLVRGVVTAGSPVAAPHDITVLLRLIKLGMRRLSLLGMPGMLKDCLFGHCCDGFHDDLAAPVASGVEFVSVASPSDGMVAYTASRHPDARFVSVDATHTGLVMAPRAIQVIEDVLADIARQRGRSAAAR